MLKSRTSGLYQVRCERWPVLRKKEDRVLTGRQPWELRSCDSSSGCVPRSVEKERRPPLRSKRMSFGRLPLIVTDGFKFYQKVIRRFFGPAEFVCVFGHDGIARAARPLELQRTNATSKRTQLVTFSQGKSFSVGCWMPFEGESRVGSTLCSPCRQRFREVSPPERRP